MIIIHHAIPVIHNKVIIVTIRICTSRSD